MKYFIIPAMIALCSFLSVEASAQSAMFNGNRFNPNTNDTPSVDRHGGIDTPSVSLYPTVTFSELTIEINFDHPESFAVYITDFTGMPVMSWYENGIMYYNKFVDVSMLAPGNYTVLLVGNNFTKSAEFTRAK